MKTTHQHFTSPAEVSSLRRRTNLGIGVGLAVSLLAAYLTTAVKDLNSYLIWGWLPMMLVGCGLFYWGIYCYVRSKGYHGLWTLLVFAPDALLRVLSFLHVRVEPTPGTSSEGMAIRGIVELSGLFVLVLLPRRRVTLPEHPGDSAPPETLNP
jgi:hypothetical protein